MNWKIAKMEEENVDWLWSILLAPVACIQRLGDRPILRPYQRDMNAKRLRG